MKRFRMLARLEIKKSVRMLPKLLAGTILLILIVTAITMSANNILGEKDEDESGETFVSIGVVCYDDSWIIDIAKGMLLGNKKIASVANIEFTDYNTAFAGLSENNYMAVIIIPENAVDDIISGVNNPFQVIFPENAGYEAAAIKEVVDSAVNLLAFAQAGIYSVYDFYGAHNAGLYRSAALDRLNESYISAVLEMGDFFADTTVVATGDLDVMEYYILSGFILFMLLFGMNSIAFMEKPKREIVMALKREKTGIGKQITARLLGILSLYGIVNIVIAAAVLIISKQEFIMIIKILLGMLPVIMTAASMVLLVMTVISYKPAAIMTMFLISVFQAFVTGGFIPKLMLPDALQALGKYTPAYYMLKELSDIYLGNNVLINTIILLLITAVFTGLSAASEYRKVWKK